MRVNIFESDNNTGIITKTDKLITIKRNRFYDVKNNWLPIQKYSRCKSFNRKYTYYINRGLSETHGIHISLNWFQNQKFLWLQGDNYFQKEDNIRYIINIIFLIIGCYIAYKQI